MRPEAPEETAAKQKPPSGDPLWHPEILGWSFGILQFYRKLAVEMPANGRMVELGVYVGRSLLFVANELRELGKLEARVIGVDPGVYYDSHAALMANVERLTAGWTGPTVEIRRERGVDAAKLYPDGSLYAAFIDGDHSEKAVYEDIVTWLPKVAKGGVLGGHDFAHPDIPGVQQGVERYFGKGRVTIEPETVWWVRV